MIKQLPIYSRDCGGCTKCCEGWLDGQVHGHKMYRGKKCHYLEDSCRIYPDRPEEPCKNYNCAWLIEQSFPGWMKPSLSNIVISKRTNTIPTEDGMKSVSYYEVIEAGEPMDSKVLNWIVHWSIDFGINVVYELHGKHHVLGTPEFKQTMLRFI